jgi:hypothetical protein
MDRQSVHAIDHLDGLLYAQDRPSRHLSGGSRVQKWVRTLSPASEFAVVILGAFGYFIFTSYVAHLQRSSDNLTDARLEYLILHELIVGAALAIFLLARG